MFKQLIRKYRIWKLAKSTERTKAQIFLNPLTNIGNHELYADGLKRMKKEIDNKGDM